MPSPIKERAYKFTLAIIDLVAKLPNNRASWVIGDQLLRSASSVGANHVEAQAATSRLEYKKFFEISLKSSLESTYWLELLRDSKLVSSQELDSLIRESSELSKMLGRSVITLKARKL